MQVTVQFYGHYSDLFAGGSMSLSLPGQPTIQNLIETLIARDARLQGIGTHCRFAVHAEYVTRDQILQDGDMVAVLPPMSGG